MKQVSLFVVVVNLCLIGMAQAGNGFVYFSSADRERGGIYGSTFDLKTGDLGPATLVGEMRSSGFLARHPNGEILYSTGSMEKGGGVAAFKIEKDGSLTFLQYEPGKDGGSGHIAVHPSGKFLITAQYGGGSVAFFPLDKEGRMGDSTVFEHEGASNVVEGRQDRPHPHWVGFSPDGRYALAPDLGTDGIMIYEVDLETPMISDHSFAPSVKGGGPRHMRFSVDGNYIYLLNEISLSLSTFSWNADEGTARRLSDAPSLTEKVKAGEEHNSAAEILVHPSGRYAYFSNRGHDSVSVYKLDPSTGLARVIQTQPIRGATPRNINLSPTGRWLLAAGQDSDTVSVHRVNPETGKLVFKNRGIIHVPRPICIHFIELPDDEEAE